MANATISDLTLASSVADTDVLLVENSTDTKKTTKKILLSGCSKEGHTHSFNELTDKPSTLDGEDGATFTPSVDSKGNLSWSNNKGLTNPTTVNIKGNKGDTGAQGIQGEQGEKGDKGDKGEDGSNGKDGLTTTVSVNGINYKHSNGVITLPNYPTDSSTKVAELEGKVATLEATVADLVARLEALEAPTE